MDMERGAYLRLGQDYLRIRNYDAALHYLGEAVMRGMSMAAQGLYDVGLHFYNEKNYRKAEEAFQLLADRGHAEACFMLGDMCQYGKGRRMDVEAAFGYFSEAFNQGLPMGAYRAGLLMTRDALASEEIRDIALTWFQEAIDGGVVEAYGAIGHLYSEHAAPRFRGGSRRDDHVALSWYLRGAFHGDGACMEEAGVYFLNGFGTVKNDKRAVELLEQAAATGRPSSCMLLGRLYEKGRGVHKNWQKAIDWYLRADALGDHRGKWNAGMAACAAGEQAALFRHQHDGTPDRAFAWFDRAIDLGYFAAYLYKARLAEEEGDRKTYLTALTLGAAQGMDDCRMELVYYYTSQARPLAEQLPALARAAHRKRKGEEARPAYRETLKEALTFYRKAGEAGDADAWAAVAKLLLHYGKDLDTPEAEFLDAVKKGKRSRRHDTEELLWQYYGPEVPAGPAVLHHEDPKKAFTSARKLAEKGKKKYFPILAEYYRNGYGVRKNMTSASHWENKE